MSAEESDQSMEEDMDITTYDDEEDASLFWSMKLEPTKQQQIGEPAINGYIVHITNACFGPNVTKQSRTVVTVNDSGPICVLRQGSHENHSLDLLFNEAATISVSGQKPSVVYLTGYIQPSFEPDNDYMDMGQMDDMDAINEDMTEAEIIETLKRQRKQQMILDDEADNDKANKEELIMDEEEEEEPQLMVEEPPQKKQKTSKGSKATKTGPNGEKQSDKKRKAAQPKPTQDKKESEGEGGSEDKSSQKKDKKKKRKMQNMKGGIKYRDMKVGDGKMVANGDKLGVYYVGQTDDKNVFDKVITGTGFEFSFGKGDVIKGWDVGLKGMRVGGKRKLIIPPKLAYGANGSPPQIPANATLTFTIMLKSVN